MDYVTALILPHCPHGQTQVGYCGPHTWWRCSVGNCYPVNIGFGVCCKWFSRKILYYFLLPDNHDLLQTNLIHIKYYFEINQD